MEQSTFLPPRSAQAEDPKRMTDEKLRQESSDLQTKAKRFQEEWDNLMADREKRISAAIKSTIDDIYSRPEDRPSLTVANVRNQVEQKLGLVEGFFVQDAGKEIWKNLIQSYAVSYKAIFPSTSTNKFTFQMEVIAEDEEEEELDVLLAQIKKSEFRLIKESCKTSPAVERQLANSTPATTTKLYSTTMIPARVSLPELSKIKQTDFKIFDDEAPKQKMVDTNRAIHFALKKMGLSDLAGIEGVSIDPKNGEVTLETGSEFNLKLAAEDRKWLGARNDSQSALRDNIPAKKIEKSTTVSYERKYPISKKEWKVVSGTHTAVTKDPAATPAGMIYKVQKATEAEKFPSTGKADNAIVRDPAVICAEMIQKVKEAKAKIANESDAKKKAEYADLMAIRESKRQEALKMADIQERRAEGMIARMELHSEEARVVREEAEAATLETYNKAHAPDKKPESKVEPGTSTAPPSVNDYFDHISRRERNKSIRTSQPLSRVSVPPQGYTVVKGSPLLHGKPSHVTLEHNTTAERIRVPPESSSSAQASERKAAIQRHINTGSYLPISRAFERRDMSNTHKDIPKPSCPTRIAPQPREYTTIREPFRQNVEQSIARATNEKEIKLNELKKFADSFKLHTTSTREPSTGPEISKHKTATSTVRDISPPPIRRNSRPQKAKQIFLSEVDDEWQNMSNTIPLVAVDPAEREWEDVDVNTTAIEVVEKELEVGEDWILVA
jgi:hypothetical protein